MRDKDTVIRLPHSDTDPRVSVTIKDEGLTLVLFFVAADVTGKGPLLELRLEPDADKPFEPWHLMPRLPLYLQYARAAIAWRDNDALAAMRALREAGATRRGLNDDFYRSVAESYDSLIAEGEQHPVKALAAMQPVDISTASRWIKEARRRGFIRG